MSLFTQATKVYNGTPQLQKPTLVPTVAHSLSISLGENLHAYGQSQIIAQAERNACVCALFVVFTANPETLY